MVNLTIDGKTIEVFEGTTVLRAAQSAGIEIPTLCDHPELTPYGGCRLCLVEVEGARTLQPSCTLPVGEKMVVKTDTDRIKEARKFVLTLLFSERNHFCPFCQVSGGDCELQNAAYDEGMTHWPLSPGFNTFGVDASGPYFILDNNRCILCRRCVRACGELVGNFTWGFEERGAKSYLVADYGVPIGESSCVSCGTCVQVCPTGALIDRQSAYRGKDFQVDTIPTVCIGCSIGCSTTVGIRDNNIVRIEGRWAEGVSGGILCKVGRFEPVDDNRERITSPMMRVNGELKPVSLDEAVKSITTVMKPLAGKNGHGVAAIASTRLPVETLHMFKQIFAGGMKSDMVTSLEEGWSTTNTTAFAEETGKVFEGKVDALDMADCVVVAAADLANHHQVLGFMVKRILPTGTKLIIIDPESNDFDPFAEVKIKTTKGTFADVFAAIKASSQDQPILELLGKCGVAEDVIISAGKILSESEHQVFIYSRGLTAKEGQPALAGLVDLAKSFSGSTILCTKGKANSVAASQLRLDKPFEVGKHQAIFVAMGDEDPSQRLIQRIEGVPFLAVTAAYKSKLTAIADVVIPVEMWAEVEGHFVNIDGRIQKVSKAKNLPEGVAGNNESLSAIANELGVSLSDDWKKELTSRPSSMVIS